MKCLLKILTFVLTLILGVNEELISQIFSEPKDTIFFEKYDELGMELKSDVKVKNKFSLIHLRKWYKVGLTQNLININESRTLKACKSTFKTCGGDASETIKYCKIFIKNGKIEIYKYRRICPFATITEIDSKGKKISKKTMRKSKYEDAYYRMMISK